MTPETIGKLEEGFLKGLSDREACLYADINPSTLYAYCIANPDFSERKELLKEQVKMQAKKNIAEAIGAGNLHTSQWYAERRDRDFSGKQEVDITSKGERINNDDAVKELSDKFNDFLRTGTQPPTDH